MAQAAIEYNEGNLAGALQLQYNAYDLAAPGSSDQARAARGIGVTNFRLGRLAIATDWAVRAYDTHSGIAEQSPEDGAALREQGASGACLGAILLGDTLTGNAAVAQRADPLQVLREAWEAISAAQELSSNPLQPDQYEIDAASSVAAAEAMLGDPEQAVAMGKLAVQLALSSESPQLVTANHNLTPWQRWQAKARALRCGCAALGAGLIVQATGNQNNKLAQRLALWAL